MSELPWRFTLEVRRESGDLAATTQASAAPCIEAAIFRSVWMGELANEGAWPDLQVTPEWLGDGRPVITGLAVGVAGGTPRPFGLEAFASQARALIRSLDAAGRIGAKERVRWNVAADPAGDPAGLGKVRISRSPFPLEPADLPDVAPGSFGVGFAAEVLAGLHDRVRSTGSVEGAELLLGRLHHDSTRRAVQLSVAEALPLTPGRGGQSNTHFAFDPGSFVAARSAALARRDGLRPVGWHHNHNPCDACLERPDCDANWVFFSEDDQQVQATLFPSPYMVALVGGKIAALPASRPGFRLYGWSGGVMEERHFGVTGPGAEAWDRELGAFADGAPGRPPVGAPSPATPEKETTCPTN